MYYTMKSVTEISAYKTLRAAKAACPKTALLIKGAKDLEKLNTTTLQDVFNATLAIHGGPEGIKPVKKFETKRVGIKRLLDLFEYAFKSKAKPEPEPEPEPEETIEAKPEGTRQGKGVYLQHGNYLKPPRPNTKRSAVLSAISRPDGATFEKLHNLIGGRRRNVNIFLQDLNRRCGYGITTEKEKGVNIYRLMGGNDE